MPSTSPACSNIARGLVFAGGNAVGNSIGEALRNSRTAFAGSLTITMRKCERLSLANSASAGSSSLHGAQLGA